MSRSDLMAHATQVGTSVVITVDATDTIVLQNLTLSSLHDADMMFT